MLTLTCNIELTFLENLHISVNSQTTEDTTDNCKKKELEQLTANWKQHDSVVAADEKKPCQVCLAEYQQNEQHRNKNYRFKLGGIYKRQQISDPRQTKKKQKRYLSCEATEGIGCSENVLQLDGVKRTPAIGVTLSSVPIQGADTIVAKQQKAIVSATSGSDRGISIGHLTSKANTSMPAMSTSQVVSSSGSNAPTKPVIVIVRKDGTSQLFGLDREDLIKQSAPQQEVNDIQKCELNDSAMRAKPHSEKQQSDVAVVTSVSKSATTVAMQKTSESLVTRETKSVTQVPPTTRIRVLPSVSSIQQIGTSQMKVASQGTPVYVTSSRTLSSSDIVPSPAPLLRLLQQPTLQHQASSNTKQQMKAPYKIVRVAQSSQQGHRPATVRLVRGPVPVSNPQSVTSGATIPCEVPSQHSLQHMQKRPLRSATSSGTVQQASTSLIATQLATSRNLGAITTGTSVISKVPLQIPTKSKVARPLTVCQHRKNKKTENTEKFVDIVNKLVPKTDDDFWKNPPDFRKKDSFMSIGTYRNENVSFFLL